MATALVAASALITALRFSRTRGEFDAAHLVAGLGHGSLRQLNKTDLFSNPRLRRLDWRRGNNGSDYHRNRSNRRLDLFSRRRNHWRRFPDDSFHGRSRSPVSVS
jgi:hypothetical protein